MSPQFFSHPKSTPYPNWGFHWIGFQQQQNARSFVCYEVRVTYEKILFGEAGGGGGCGDYGRCDKEIRTVFGWCGCGRCMNDVNV